MTLAELSLSPSEVDTLLRTLKTEDLWKSQATSLAPKEKEIIIPRSISMQVLALFEETNHVRKGWFGNPYEKLMIQARKILEPTIKEATDRTAKLIKLNLHVGAYLSLVERSGHKVSKESVERKLGELHQQIHILCRALDLPSTYAKYHYVASRASSVPTMIDTVAVLSQKIGSVESLHRELEIKRDELFIAILGSDNYNQWLKLMA